MAFVSIPKDLTKVKTKVVLNLTKRQLLCFGAAAAIGVPTYFLTRGVLGNMFAVVLMIALMLPAFLMAMYEKDGQPAEKVLLHILRAKWYAKGRRPYKTENLYQYIEKEGNIARKDQKQTAKVLTQSAGRAGAPAKKRGAGQASKS